MNAGLMAVLTDTERLLVGQTEAPELRDLDEDAAVALEARIRRARDKFTGQYRRSAATRVADHGGRRDGPAAEPARDRPKTEHSPLCDHRRPGERDRPTEDGTFRRCAITVAPGQRDLSTLNTMITPVIDWFGRS